MSYRAEELNRNRARQRWQWCVVGVCGLLMMVAAQPVFAGPNCEMAEMVEIFADDANAGDHFGVAVDLGSMWMIVGAENVAQGSDSDVGAAYVFRQVGSDWEEHKLMASNGQEFDLFGEDVALQGNTALIGASGAEAVYVFEFDGANWIEEQILTPSTSSGADEFGSTVALAGDIAIIGARSFDGIAYNSGAAFVFRRQGGSFVEETMLTAPDSSFSDYFGTSVAVNGNRAIIGASNDDDNGSNSGSAHIFRYDPTDCSGELCPWIHEAKLTPDSDGGGANEFLGDVFGFAVGISGDAAVVGARKHDFNGMSQAGAAYVFRSDGNGGWYQEQKLFADDADPQDQFGYSVDIHGTLIAIGAKAADQAPWPSAGAVYSFRLNNGAWEAETKGVDSDAYWDDWVGTDVAIWNDTILAGAEGTDLYEGGGYFSGSAFLFPSLCEAMDCPGDITTDGVVNFADLAWILGSWSSSYDSAADLNGDGNVDLDDLSVLLANWGSCL